MWPKPDSNTYTLIAARRSLTCIINQTGYWLHYEDWQVSFYNTYLKLNKLSQIISPRSYQKLCCGNSKTYSSGPVSLHLYYWDDNRVAFKTYSPAIVSMVTDWMSIPPRHSCGRIIFWNQPNTNFSFLPRLQYFCEQPTIQELSC